jgi:DNA-binding NarL/FixJ family response regulator
MRALELSPERAKVFELLAQGKSDPEIADILGLPVKAVRSQVTMLYRILQITSRFEAIRYGIRIIPSPWSVDFSSLSNDALKLAGLIAAGNSNHKIGRLLYYSESTITKYIREQLFEPFGFKNRYALTAAYLAWLQNQKVEQD